jgi:hypothetical protein
VLIRTNKSTKGFKGPSNEGKRNTLIKEMEVNYMNESILCLNKTDYDSMIKFSNNLADHVIVVEGS